MRIISAVINDLVTDQRVHRSCMLMHEMGHSVCLIGRKLPNSIPMPKRPYKTIRMHLLFKKGAFFYAFFNMRLFLRLLFTRFDAIWANDLDTLYACRLASKLKGKKLVYDSHEYFTGVPELMNRPRVQKIWKRIERRIVPKLPFMITVNDSIAGLFADEYKIPVLVIRNVPIRGGLQKTKTRAELGLPDNKTVLIVQGRGINIDRGIEEAVEAMQYVENALLLIVGGGDVFPIIEKMVVEKQLQQKVMLVPPVGREELFQYTTNADIGLTLDKDTNINYRFSLPNKVFDYINAGCAVLSSNLPELAKLVKQYEIGSIASNHLPEAIALDINNMILNQTQLNVWKKNASKASEELCWENESQKLYEKLGEYFG